MGTTAAGVLEQTRAGCETARRRVEELRVRQRELVAQIDAIAAGAKAGVVGSDGELSELARQKCEIDQELVKASWDLAALQVEERRAEEVSGRTAFEGAIEKATEERTALIKSFRETCMHWGEFLAAIKRATDAGNSLIGPFGGPWPEFGNRIRALQVIDPFKQQTDTDIWAVSDWPHGTVQLPSLRPMVATFAAAKEKK